MSKFLLRSSIICTFVTYLLSQTQLLKDDRESLQYVIVSLMILSIIFVIKLHPHEFGRIFSNVRVMFAFTSIILFNLVFFDPTQFWVIIFKVFFLLTCLAFLFSQSGAKIYITIADSVALSVLVIGVLAELGIVPSTISEMEAWTKNSVGFNNPNTPYYFLFSSFLIYFIFNSTLKLIACLLLMVALIAVDSFSRTYVIGTVFICLIGLFIRYRFVHTVIRPMLFVLMLFCSALGSLFYLTAAVNPSILQPLVLTPLDVALSYRLSLALEDIYIPAKNLVGFSFGTKDSIYNELLFFLSPIFLIMFFQGIYRWWITSKYDSNALRMLAVLSMISVTGLMETIFLNLTPISAIFFSVAVFLPARILNVINANQFDDRA